MARRQIHRGPDEEGFFVDRFAALGSRRLSIVDLAGGRQPIGSESGGVQVVYNGEIYNYRQLREDLQRRGHRFATASDTEVIVHSYEEAGPESLKSFNGMFALAIWDAPRRLLLLARDPLGIKPLYYVERGGMFAFASEAKALLSLPFVTPEVDEESLDLYLTFRFVPSPRTLFRGIRKLGPGEMLIRPEGQVAHLQHYAPPPPAPDLGPSQEDWAEGMLAELRSAVKRQMMGDVPVGILLSGGMDSAAVLALAAETGGPTLRSYTVGFAEAPKEDEVVAAAETARHFGVEHLHVTLNAAAYREKLVPSAYSLDEPVATPSVAPYAALCQLAAEQHKVVLCGQGADEPLGGYARHLGEKLAALPLMGGFAPPLKLAASMLPGNERLQRLSRVFHARRPVSRFVEAFTLFPPREIQRLRGKCADFGLLEAAVEPILDGTDRLDSLARFLFLDSRFSLADDLLLYGDKIAMASSLEVRVPFLDLEFLRFVERIPASLRVSLLRPKQLLRMALKNVLPRAILNRHKRNFSPPDSTWMERSQPGPGLHWLLEPSAAAAQYFRRDEVARLVQEQYQGKRDRRRQLFALLAFELWNRSFFNDSQMGHGTKKSDSLYSGDYSSTRPGRT
jgi:asparagine synthase (glutamine-hydrolysing)